MNAQYLVTSLPPLHTHPLTLEPPPPPKLLIPWVGPLDVYPFGSFRNGRFRRKLTESSQYFIIISLLHCFLLNKQLISLSNFQFLLGYPLGVQEDCFLPVSGQHHHLQKKDSWLKKTDCYNNWNMLPKIQTGVLICKHLTPELIGLTFTMIST